ncbi:MAG TPA: asparagine synthetase B [Candidatus Thermoplasmatota archaeon]|nr:asparagine synthetase B [Candidatus Thermoplasmatota archaeon]
MCTVCGILTDRPAHASVPRVVDMLKATRHRGPDACGIHAGDGVVHAPTPEALADATRATPPASVVLGQSRLAITGSRDARQPIVSRDGRLALAHNGEVYNHEALRTLLPPESQPETGCDSDIVMGVLEHHYAATADLAEAMRRTVGVASGMYALAASDGETLVLARDAVGKKPLYVVEGNGTLAFASERKALATLSSALDAPIRALRPGEMLVRTVGAPTRIERSERVSVPAPDITEMGPAVAAYEAALDRAIARRTRGLERAAVFFSGGVDSVMVARLLQRAGVDVRGYVVGTADSSDVRYAEEVAAEMRLPITVTTVDEDAVAEALPRILAATELHGPMMAEVSVPMWFAAKAAHEDGHRVVFTGQAADELFAGYDWYRGVLAEHGPLTLHARLWEDILALPVDTLEREDRISMAWSLEMRAPFLDADVIRTAMRISPTLKLAGPDDLMGKRPHRMLAERIGVPVSVAYRTKVPAQDGASIHDLLERIAGRELPEEVEAPDVPDFGSNYRYRDRVGAYGSPRVRAYLARLVERHGILVAEADGTARARTKRVEVSAPAPALPAER